MDNIRRVIFYSKYDLSSGHNLKNAEPILENFKDNRTFKINDIIELNHIKTYFDNEIFLNSWSVKTKEKYLRTARSFPEVIRNFWKNVNNDNILYEFDQVDYQYYESFWNLFDQFNTFNRIDASIIKKITESGRFNIRQILKQIKTVNYYSSVIKDFLFSNPDSAEILLSHFEEEKSSTQKRLYFPKSLTELDVEKIIENYLELPDANLNYVRLAVKSRGIKLSNKLKFKAKKLSDKLNDEIMDNGSTWKQGVQVGISKDQREPIIIKYDDKNNTLIHTYSENFLLETLKPIRVLMNFHGLFGYLNNQGCINLVTKKSEVDGFESIFMRSKNDYINYSSFVQKSHLSQAQLYIYEYFLNTNDICLEEVLSFCVNEHFNENYSINGLKISFASESASYLEKIRMLAPELEFLLKQYQSFSEDGFIDFDLLEFSSSPLNISQIKSRVRDKYVYGKGHEFLRVKYDLFSDQSMLGYIEPFKDKYRTLSQLLDEEDVRYEDFEYYQKVEIDFLISEKFLFIDTANLIKFYNRDLIYAIGLLHSEEVISYWHYPLRVRNQIQYLLQKGWVIFEDMLFTVDERKYLNYYLNQKEFTNGLDLRNKYLHGTNSSLETEQKEDYYILIKILIIVILKIRDDLFIENALKKTGTNN